MTSVKSCPASMLDYHYYRNGIWLLFPELHPAGQTLEPVLICRMDASFAALSICMSCVWLNLVASEVVSLLQTFGFIFNAPTVCTHAAPVNVCLTLLYPAPRKHVLAEQTDSRKAVIAVNYVLHVLPVKELQHHQPGLR